MVHQAAGVNELEPRSALTNGDNMVLARPSETPRVSRHAINDLAMLKLISWDSTSFPVCFAQACSNASCRILIQMMRGLQHMIIMRLG